MNGHLKKGICNMWTLAEYVRLMFRYSRCGSCRGAGRMMAYSDIQVRHIMRCAYRIPFYRKKFEECGLKPGDFKRRKDLMKFPVTSKAELREWMKCEQAKGSSRTCFVNRTSGSSGMALEMLYGIHDKAVATAAWMRILRLNGYHPFTDCVMAVKAHAPLKGGTIDSFVQKFGLLRRYTYSALLETSQLAEALNEKRPDLLYANKSILVSLALYAAREHIQLHRPRMVCSTSELLDAHAREIIIGCFGDALFESYGAEEVSAFTYTKCGRPDRHHITWDTHTFITRRTDGSLSLNKSGDIIVTSLYQRKYPVINYELKDRVEISVDGGVPYIRRVCGRQTDWFVFADGSRKGFQPFYVLAEECPYCLQMRFIQLDLWNITVQCVRNEVPVSRVQAEEWIAARLKQLIRKEGIKCRFEWLDEIPVGSNGKVKFMISHVTAE